MNRPAACSARCCWQFDKPAAPPRLQLLAQLRRRHNDDGADPPNRNPPAPRQGQRRPSAPAREPRIAKTTDSRACSTSGSWLASESKRSMTESRLQRQPLLNTRRCQLGPGRPSPTDSRHGQAGSGAAASTHPALSCSRSSRRPVLPEGRELGANSRTWSSTSNQSRQAGSSRISTQCPEHKPTGAWPPASITSTARQREPAADRQGDNAPPALARKRLNSCSR